MVRISNLELTKEIDLKSYSYPPWYTASIVLERQRGEELIFQFILPSTIRIRLEKIFHISFPPKLLNCRENVTFLIGKLYIPRKKFYAFWSKNKSFFRILIYLTPYLTKSTSRFSLRIWDFIFTENYSLYKIYWLVGLPFWYVLVILRYQNHLKSEKIGPVFKESST